MDQAALDRFWAKVQKRDGENGCWEWTSANFRRYGLFWLNGKTEWAHRLAYELLVGPIPDGLTLDHLCRNPSCVNPAHLEPVTQSENARRANPPKTLCKHGHEYTEANTILLKSTGKRQCRICSRYIAYSYHARTKGRMPLTLAQFEQRDTERAFGARNTP